MVAKKAIRIKLKSYDAQLLDQSAKRIVEAAKRTGSQVNGPVPLPTDREVFTILRSPHVNKDSREQFERRTHKRLIDINRPTQATVDVLMKLQLPSGVEIQVKQVTLMKKGLLMRKVGMTQIFLEDGSICPVTVLEAKGGNTVLQVKTVETDGYSAYQLGFEDKKERVSTKAEIAHAKKAGSTSWWPRTITAKVPAANTRRWSPAIWVSAPCSPRASRASMRPISRSRACWP